MNNGLTYSILIGYLLTAAYLSPILAQPIYTMSNALVDDCDGLLTDSEAGQTPGHYDHDENFTFTICVPGASSISLNFSSFCLEDGFDFVRIFDGPDTLSPQLGPAYTGINLPPPIASSSGCLTVHFVSDANVTCTGWVAQWETSIEEPLLPMMTLVDQTPPCSTQNIIVNFDAPVPCDSLISGNLLVNGPSGSSVIAATPLNCTNDSATSAQLTVSPGLNASGIYEVSYQSFFLDQCDSLWTLSTRDTLTVIDCPLEVELFADTLTVCEGFCTTLFAEATGGDMATYTFVWNPPLPPGPGPHSVCPSSATSYTVTVSDANGSTPASDMISLTVNPAPTMPANQTICQSDAPITLFATPAGGWWGGPGIIDNWLGEFHPDTAGAGIHTISYYGPNGCPGEVQITVQEIEAGLPEAACPGTPSFMVSGFSPFGGAWSGPNITPSGLITPPATSGVFTITYTANGCTDSKEIYIDNPILAIPDTICESLPWLNLTASPPGGIWSGTGIVDPIGGGMDPNLAGPGSHIITYSLVGCAASEDIFVKAISIGDDFVACPEGAPIAMGNPQPAGGTWSSTMGGIIDPIVGMFDPGANGGQNFFDTISYTIDGCSASRIAYVIQTDIELDPDTLQFCREDTAIYLDWWTVMRRPWNGNWTGSGVTDPNWPGMFDPFTADHGIHTLVYTANGCADSMTMVVHPRSIPQDTAVCELASAFVLPHSPAGGIWSGEAILDSLSGVFDPQMAGIGMHRVFYQSPLGCLDSADIEVFALPPLSIQQLEPQYCYKDTSYVLIGSPAGGTFSGPGIVGNRFFPLQAGVGGPHLIRYTFGFGDCQQTVLGITQVGPPLELSLAFEEASMCPGEFLTLSAEASMGNGAPYRYTWDQGLGQGASHTISPLDSSIYTVNASDGCSDDISAQVRIGVYPDFELTFAQSEAICFGEQGFAVAQVEGPSVYAYEWNTEPPQGIDTLYAPTGFGYEVVVTDVISGCEERGTTEIPRFPYVEAAFLPNPNDRCLTVLNPTFQFIDQSVGADTGYWDFGDGQVESYVFGQTPTHAYPEPGEYVVSLFLSNAGNCADSFSTQVCVVPEESGITVPNAFSPNGDGFNDAFFLASEGIQTMDMKIFDRWGRIIFESQQADARWDGSFIGEEVPEGVYTYVIQGTIIANNPLTNYAPRLFLEKGTITLLR